MKTLNCPAVRIRRVGLNRLNDLIELEKSSFTTDISVRRNLRNLLRSPSAVCMAAYGCGRLTGSMVLLFRSGTRSARVYSLAVSPEDRGRGIGRRLMVRAEKEARLRGCTKMRLEVRMDNVPAIRLYEQLGFVDTQVLPGYYEDGAHAMIFRKDI